MSKHTRGKYWVGSYCIYASQYARAEFPIHAKKRGLVGKAYRESDATLFASANELLEALQMVRDYVVTLTGNGHPYQLAIDAAIAKATGGGQ